MIRNDLKNVFPCSPCHKAVDDVRRDLMLPRQSPSSVLSAIRNVFAANLFHESICKFRAMDRFSVGLSTANNFIRDVLSLRSFKNMLRIEAKSVVARVASYWSRPVSIGQVEGNLMDPVLAAFKSTVRIWRVGAKRPYQAFVGIVFGNRFSNELLVGNCVRLDTLHLRSFTARVLGQVRRHWRPAFSHCTTAALLIVTSWCHAQTVTISGFVLDPNGKAYANGTGKAQLTPGAVQWLYGNNPVPTPVIINALDSFGHFSITLMNTSLISPASMGPQWQFSFCSQTYSVQPIPVCFTMTPMSLTTSQDINTQIQAQSALLPALGTTITLQTNGTPNGSQTLLNLAQGTNITVTDNGFGTDTFAVTGVITGPTANGGLTQTGTTLGLLTSCSGNQVLQWNGSAWICATISGGGTVTGSGTATTYPIWSSSSALGDSTTTETITPSQTNIRGQLRINTGNNSSATSQLNLFGGNPPYFINTISRTSNVVTAVIPSSYVLPVGTAISVTGVTDSSFNGNFTTTTATTTGMSWAQTAADASSSSGTIYIDSQRMVTIGTSTAEGLLFFTPGDTGGSGASLGFKFLTASSILNDSPGGGFTWIGGNSAGVGTSTSPGGSMSLKTGSYLGSGNNNGGDFILNFGTGHGTGRTGTIIVNGSSGFSGTKTAGSCSLTVLDGIITNITGC